MMLFNHDKPIEEKEFPDEADLAELDAMEDSDEELFQCPYCGRFIYGDADKCPYCGQWLAGSDSKSWRSSRKWYVRAGLYLTKVLVLNWILWLIIAGLVALIAAIRAFR